MDNILNKTAEKMTKERAKFIDDSLFNAIPKWKTDILNKLKSKWVARFLNIKAEIEHHRLNYGFGEEIVIKLNNKVIARRKFK